MSDQKIQNIEETLAHQEQQISDLSEMVVRQGDEIALLKKHIVKLEDKIETLEDDNGAPGDEGLSISEIAARDKPPHY